MASSPRRKQPSALPASPKAAVLRLKEADPALGRAIQAVGPFRLPRRVPGLHLLCASVIGQSISVKAARTIVNRFTDKFGGPETLQPRGVLRAKPETLRAIGINGTKVDAIRGLAEIWQQERWTPETVVHVPDEELLARLTAVRGIGPWTVKMFLIFGLRRPNVLPQEDLGLQEGIKLIDGMDRRPTQREVLARAESWRPWSTIATVYAWQYLMHASNTSIDDASNWWKE